MNREEIIERIGQIPNTIQDIQNQIADIQRNRDENSQALLDDLNTRLSAVKREGNLLSRSLEGFDKRLEEIPAEIEKIRAKMWELTNVSHIDEFIRLNDKITELKAIQEQLSSSSVLDEEIINQFSKDTYADSRGNVYRGEEAVIMGKEREEQLAETTKKQVKKLKARVVESKNNEEEMILLEAKNDLDKQKENAQYLIDQDQLLAVVYTDNNGVTYYGEEAVVKLNETSKEIDEKYATLKGDRGLIGRTIVLPIVPGFKSILDGDPDIDPDDDLEYYEDQTPEEPIAPIPFPNPQPDDILWLNDPMGKDNLRSRFKRKIIDPNDSKKKKLLEILKKPAVIATGIAVILAVIATYAVVKSFNPKGNSDGSIDIVVDDEDITFGPAETPEIPSDLGSTLGDELEKIQGENTPTTPSKPKPSGSGNSSGNGSGTKEESKVQDTSKEEKKEENTKQEEKQEEVIEEIVEETIEEEYEELRLTINYSNLNPTNQDVGIGITANNEIASITSTNHTTNWLPGSKKSYSATYAANGSETVTVTDVYGQTAIMDVNVNNIDKSQLIVTPTVSYNANSSAATVSLTSNKILKIEGELLNWSQISSTYFTDIFYDNVVYSFDVEDIYGNTTTVIIQILGINKELEEEIDDPNKNEDPNNNQNGTISVTLGDGDVIINGGEYFGNGGLPSDNNKQQGDASEYNPTYNPEDDTVTVVIPRPDPSEAVKPGTHGEGYDEGLAAELAAAEKSR